MNLDSRRFRFTLATFCSSQYLKELLFSCFRIARFRSESGCKDKIFFRFLPNLFQTFFFSLVIQYFSNYPTNRRKVYLFQHFKNSTENYHSSLILTRLVFCFAGAKIRQRFPRFQIFSRLFFKFFSLHTTRT